MDALTLGRLLFASTAGLHYLFVSTTLGLGPLVAVLSTRAARRPCTDRDGALRVLGRLYVINYSIGIVTGLVMELQMALVWSGPGALVQDRIATLLALETVVAFFLESTLLGIWLAGAGTLGRGSRAAVFWAVTVTAYTSAAFVIGANSFLHRPIDLTAPRLGWIEVQQLLFRPATVTVLSHAATSSMVVGGFWAAAAGARVHQRQGDEAVARCLLRIGVTTVAWAAPLAVVTGLTQFSTVRTVAPNTGAHGLALVTMMVVGVLVTLGTWILVLPLSWHGALIRRRWGRRLLIAGVPIPLATTFLGWLYREEARQPWFVVGQVTTAEAITPLPVPQLMLMCVVFICIGCFAAITAWRLMNAAMHTRSVPQRPDPDREPDPLGLD